MAKIANKQAENNLPFIAATIKDSKLTEEHAKYLLSHSDKESLEVKNTVHSELSVGLSTNIEKPRVLIVGLKFMVNVVEAANESIRVAEYSSIQQQTYDVLKIYGDLDEKNIPVHAVQPYVHAALTAAASRARDTFGRFGMTGMDFPISTEFNPPNAVAPAKK